MSLVWPRPIFPKAPFVGLRKRAPLVPDGRGGRGGGGGRGRDHRGGGGGRPHLVQPRLGGAVPAEEEAAGAGEGEVRNHLGERGPAKTTRTD